MGIFELFSVRQKRLRGEIPDVYSYDKLPQTLKIQIAHMLKEIFITQAHGQSYIGEYEEELLEFIRDALRKEWGVFQLVDGYSKSNIDEVINGFLQVNSVDKALDVIEICFRMLDIVMRKEYRANKRVAPDEGIEELNKRFQMHGVGYAYESGEIIRIDSQFVHAEVVKPVLGLLREKAFSGANDEFMTAHEHYRHGRHKECLNECLKAFESAMKTICKKRKWEHDEIKDNASKLIDVCFSNGLIPSAIQSEFTALKSLLASGIPTVRNRMGGHGQGEIPVQVPAHIASYALHLTAANLLLLFEADKALG